jgi:RIO-like serine/threonine protein kinase
LLKRDISAVTKFFARSYGLALDPDAAYGYVAGKRRFPAIRRG